MENLNLQRLIVWVDAMCPCNGDEEIRSEPDLVFQGVTGWRSVRALPRHRASNVPGLDPAEKEDGRRHRRPFRLGMIQLRAYAPMPSSNEPAATGQVRKSRT